jgi:hypothetical protein
MERETSAISETVRDGTSLNGRKHPYTTSSKVAFTSTSMDIAHLLLFECIINILDPSSCRKYEENLTF